MGFIKEQQFELPEDYDQPHLIEQLATDFSLEAGPAKVEKVAIYDTFDWRLYKKSLVLEGGGHRLRLRQLFDWEISHSLETKVQPVFVWDLPEGELRAYLEPVIEMRALLRLAQLQTNSTSYRVLNQAEKTVVRLTCEEVRLLDQDGVTLATYVRVKPVKGYSKYDKRLVKRLEGLGLSTVAADDVYFKALATAGKTSGDYSSKLEIQLTPAMGAAEATKVILRFLLGVIKVNEGYIKQDIDTEFLHDFRVAVRRTRAALTQIRAVFPEEPTQRFKTDFAYIGQFSNRLRDLDVYLLNEHSYRAMLPAPLDRDIEPLFELLRQKRSEAWQDVINGLNSERYVAIRQDWEMFLNEPPADAQTALNAGRPIIDLAQERIYKHYRRIVKFGQDISEDAEEKKLHALRIECKTLRYLIEFFASLFPAIEIALLTRQLKKLQDNLGEFNDLCVQQEYLLSLAAELPGEGPPARRTILAVGSLIGALDDKKQQVKGAFAQTFTDFVAPATQQLVKALFTCQRKRRPCDNPGFVQ